MTDHQGKRKVYRYLWSNGEKRFLTPENIPQLSSKDNSDIEMMLGKFTKKSGLDGISTLSMMTILVIVFLIIIGAGFGLMTISRPAGAVCMAVAPFLSFSFMAFIMVRNSGIKKIEEFQKKELDPYRRQVLQYGLQFDCHFVKSKQNLFSGSSSEEKNCKRRCVKKMLPEEIEGYIELVEGSDTSSDLVQEFKNNSAPIEDTPDLKNQEQLPLNHPMAKIAEYTIPEEKMNSANDNYQNQLTHELSVPKPSLNPVKTALEDQQELQP